MSEAGFPVVSTVQGDLRGSILKSVTGRDIFSFRGVRFAQPPLGELRFKAPVPPEPWQGIRNATEVRPQNYDYGTISEDCLFLNVYTNKLPSKSGNPKRPVLIFFHAGPFYSITGNSRLYGPQYLVDQDIVLVTTNYRLGALGFLSAQDAVLRGNYGMKDQVQVLRWVNQNIAAFGGDPESVTISGCSAGSFSVIFHMMSPMSQGLFHRCIAMSGSPAQYELDISPLEHAKKLAALFNCSTSSSQEIVDCLREKKAEDIDATLSNFTGRVLVPVVEPDLGDGAERFLTDHPLKLLLSGKFSRVPLLIGVTSSEFSWVAARVIGNDSLAEDMTQNFETMFPLKFLYEQGTERSKYISRELRKFYLKDQPITKSSEEGLGQLYSDSIIGFGVDRGAKIISSISSSPVYFCRFSYEGRYSHIYEPPDSKIPYGVVHRDDLIYLFYISSGFPLFTPQDPEYKTMQKMTTMWANFVKSGNPTPEPSDLLDNAQWQPFTSSNLKYMDVGSTLEMKTSLNQDRMAVWERLFPLPSDTRPSKGGIKTKNA